MRLHELPARTEGGFHVVVESPRGARLKMKYAPDEGLFFGGRALPLGQQYPFDWGFIPGTRAADGDPFDALVYWEVPSFPGTVLRCRLLGVLQLEQTATKRGGVRERNDRVVVVPLDHPRCDHVKSILDLAPRVRDELAHFFTSAVFFTPKDPRVVGWKGPREAEALVSETIIVSREARGAR